MRYFPVMIRRLAIPLCVLASACSNRSGSSAPSTGTSGGTILSIVNARIWTGDRATPWAQAIAVSGQQIVAVGTNDAVREAAPGISPIDAGGRLVVPGFIDAHVHFVDGGFRLASVQLRD